MGLLLGNLHDLLGDLPGDGAGCPPPESTPTAAGTTSGRTTPPTGAGDVDRPPLRLADLRRGRSTATGP
jgi:hypothetical protein